MSADAIELMSDHDRRYLADRLARELRAADRPYYWPHQQAAMVRLIVEPTPDELLLPVAYQRAAVRRTQDGGRFPQVIPLSTQQADVPASRQEVTP
ncbi:MAG TPA: hypothetical protein VND92_08525 [Vicinamibacterales bacterium]|nr:hypothetical protein [Vicinamibacterales bacterium]